MQLQADLGHQGAEGVRGSSAGARRARGLLLAFPAITFSGQCHFLSLSPFLLAIAHELGTDLAATGQLMAWMALAWGSASIASGPASDRFGRKAIPVVGLSLLSLSSVASALVTDFAQMSVLRFLAGLGGGTMTPSVFAAVGDNFLAKERGRALGWVWMMSELSGTARGTVMGLHVSMSSSGWIVASTMGGLLIALGGFGLLGGFSAAASITSAAAAAAVLVLQLRAHHRSAGPCNNDQSFWDGSCH